MLANEGDLEKLGDDLSKQHGYKVVVFGHTHVGKIDKDSLFVKNRGYVNSGCWCGKQAHCAVLKPGYGGKTTVALLAIDKDGAIVEDESPRLQL